MVKGLGTEWQPREKGACRNPAASAGIKDLAGDQPGSLSLEEELLEDNQDLGLANRAHLANGVRRAAHPAYLTPRVSAIIPLV